MTLFIEPYRKPHEHMMVVQSLLLLESSRNETIYFLSTKDYFNSIPVYCKEKVNFIEIKNLHFSSRLQILDIFYFVFKYSRKLNPSRIILLSTKSYASLLIKIWTLFSSNRQNIPATSC